ncbi:hypothetical protein C8F01DRAFT_1080157 [Mycena amicta]|nr:hypothetical protein C8F01DRAFT_1080157 [Mycena amicta]
MPLDPNHHQPSRRGSPPPVVGAVRPLPDHTVSSDSDTAPNQPDVTKSPQTRRIVKRRRHGHPSIEPLVFDTSPAAQQPPASEPVPASGEPGPDTSRASPPTWSEDQALLLTALESILTRAVATTGALQLEGETVASYPPVVRAGCTASFASKTWATGIGCCSQNLCFPYIEGHSIKPVWAAGARQLLSAINLVTNV